MCTRAPYPPKPSPPPLPGSRYNAPRDAHLLAYLFSRAPELFPHTPHPNPGPDDDDSI